MIHRKRIRQWVYKEKKECVKEKCEKEETVGKQTYNHGFPWLRLPLNLIG